MTTLMQDLRYALRQMRHAPGFSLGVIVVLALGIGANAAMFTVLEGTLFRPLPYYSAGELVHLAAKDSKGGDAWTRLADAKTWEARSHTLKQIAYYEREQAYLSVNTSGAASSERRVSSVFASPNLFATLGVSPVLGRTFTAEEQMSGKEHVAVVSDTVWRLQFHADRGVVGETVRINDVPATVIGVMPPGFLFPADDGNQGDNVQVWMPALNRPTDSSRDFAEGSMTYEAIARRASSASAEDVTSELSGIQRQNLPLYAASKSLDPVPAQVLAVDYRRTLNEKDQRTALLALQGAVGVLWLIACANVACLMLARIAARRREMAVRAALGASGWRLVRQTLTESLLLSLAGGLAGLGLAEIALQILQHNLATQLSPNLSLHPDLRVLFALLALSLVTGFLLGVVPYRVASTLSVEQALRQDGAQAGTGRNQHRLQRVLVISELALTLALLVCCGLLLRTVFALRHVPLGFRTDHVFVIQTDLPGYKYVKLDPNAFVYKPLLERLKALPGVQYAAITTVVPLGQGFDSALSLYLNDEKNTHDSNQTLVAALRASGPEYQHVLGFRMLQGRYFSAEDTPDSQLVGVVNQAFAKLYAPNGGDVMKWEVGGKDRKLKIVGIIEDFHQQSIAEPARPELDINAAQMRSTDAFYQPTLQAHAEFVLRANRAASSLVPDINHAMEQFNPDLAGTKVLTMEQIVEDAMGPQILAAHLLEMLGGLALLVALAGLYCLLTYLVTLRTRELGLRLALGAQRKDILSLVLRGAGALLVAGTVTGIGISLAIARLMHSFLFGVKQYDVMTLIGAPLLLLVVGTLAAWLPARRAAGLEPMQALRTE